MRECKLHGFDYRDDCQYCGSFGYAKHEIVQHHEKLEQCPTCEKILVEREYDFQFCSACKTAMGFVPQRPIEANEVELLEPVMPETLTVDGFLEQVNQTNYDSLLLYQLEFATKYLKDLNTKYELKELSHSQADRYITIISDLKEFFRDNSLPI
jgi:hypothetical protein